MNSSLSTAPTITKPPSNADRKQKYKNTPLYWISPTAGSLSSYADAYFSTGVDCIKSVENLSAFWHTYQNTLDEILNTHGTECQIYLFPAMPVSAAFEVGRRYMLNTHPSITIFDENNGFFETLKMGVKADDR